MDIAIYVAIAENGVIGREGGLPWRLSTDLKRFKAGTMGKPIIMGRKTWQRARAAVARPAQHRRDARQDFRAEGAEVAASLADAIALAKARARCMAGADEICVIGGGEIYAQAMPLADRLNVTHVLGEVDGDTRFPPIDPEIWRVVSTEDLPAGEKDTHATRYTVYERRMAVH